MEALVHLVATLRFGKNNSKTWKHNCTLLFYFKVWQKQQQLGRECGSTTALGFATLRLEGERYSIGWNRFSAGICGHEEFYAQETVMLIIGKPTQYKSVQF